MLEILQTSDYSKYADIINKLNLGEIQPNVVEATDNGKTTGFAVYHFDIENKQTVLDVIDDGGDLLLLDGIVRAVLFLSMMRGIDSARFDVTDLDRLRKLGFVHNSGKLTESISDFMSKCKSCGKNHSMA